MDATPDEFLEELRSAVLRWGGAEWVGARVDGDAVIVLFRQDEARGSVVVAGPVQGTRLELRRFAEGVLGPGEHRLSDVLGEAVLEIVEPHESGPTLQVDWADGLCDDPASVRWRPDAVEAAARQR